MKTTELNKSETKFYNELLLEDLIEQDLTQEQIKTEMENKELTLTEKEVNILISSLYTRFSDDTLENNPETVAAKLLNKLYDKKDEFKLKK
jgi:hypothetical protein|tara:strand:- start:342 stop:614 length:273 start_codon:yes stop_codon:yes gene_type:complete